MRVAASILAVLVALQASAQPLPPKSAARAPRGCGQATNVVTSHGPVYIDDETGKIYSCEGGQYALLEVDGPVRYGKDNATSGSGTSGDPWKGWWTGLKANTTVVFPKGYYVANDGLGGGSITIPDGATILCDEGAVSPSPRLGREDP